MRGIDHQPGGFAGLARQLGEDFAEDAEAAPAHEPIIDRLVGTVVARCIAPAQSVPDDEDDAAPAGRQLSQSRVTTENTA